MTWYPIESKLELFLSAKVRSFFDMTKSCALYFFVSLHKTIPLPTKKKDEGNLRRHTLVYRY